jgi:hypothetical protein
VPRTGAWGQEETSEPCPFERSETIMGVIELSWTS